MSILVPQKFLFSTIRIRYLRTIGCAVLVRIHDDICLITAAHLVDGLQPNDSIAFDKGSGWHFLKVSKVAFAQNGHDLAVLDITSSTEVEGDYLTESECGGSILLGQEVVYCGFPLGLKIETGHPNGHPIPFLKSGIFSGLTTIDGSSDQLMYFESLNNNGFSGGPIIMKEHETNMLRIVAIVSGYKFDLPLKVYRGADIESATTIADTFVKPNSGFMFGSSMTVALDLHKLL